MSKDRNDLGVSSEKLYVERPDFFGYYKCRAVELFSKDHNFSLSGPRASKSNGGVSEPLFGGGVGATLSGFDRESLTIILRRAVKDLTSEVDSIMGPVKRMSDLQIQRRDKMRVSEEGSGPPHKKVKAMASSAGNSQTKMNDAAQVVLEENSSELDEIMTKFSDELYAKLDYAEQQLEELLDASMSTCRIMTDAERKQLQKMIKVLPRKNLDHIAGLVQRNRAAEEKSSDEVFVDLLQESNVTLWRMYYYIKAVESAKKLFPILQ